MKINYRVLSYNEKDHSMTVRYWTDEISEDELCNYFDEYGKIVYNANGHPVRTRGDVNLTFYDNPNPSDEDIINKIKTSGPISWLELMEKNKLSNVEYSLANVASFVGVSNNFDYISMEMQNEFKKQIQANLRTSIINTNDLVVEKAAKVTIRYIKTGIYDLRNTESYVIE